MIALLRASASLALRSQAVGLRAPAAAPRWMSTVAPITSAAEFKAASEAAGDKLMLVDFYADWCGPCKLLKPKLDKLAKDMTQQVSVHKVNCDDAQDLAAAHAVSALPTVVLFKKGVEVDRFMGARDDGFLRSFITNHLDK